MDNIKREKSFAAAGIQAPDRPARSLLAISTALFRLPIKGTESDVFVPRWELMFCVSGNTLFCTAYTLGGPYNCLHEPNRNSKTLAILKFAAFEYQITRLKLHETLNYLQTNEANGLNGPKRETDHKHQ